MEDIREAPSNIIYIGFWRRVCAYLIDAIITMPLFIAYLKYYKYFITNKMPIPIIAYYVIIYCYHIICNVRFGGTPGKLIMKIRIVNKNLKFISISKAIIRYSINFPSLVTFFILKFVPMNANLLQIVNIFDIVFFVIIFIDGFVIVFNKRKRALHDYIVDSYVIDKKSLLQ